MKIYRKNDDAIGAHVGNSVVILNIESLKYFELTDVASRIWELLDQGPLSEDQICSHLLSEFEVEAKHCRDALHSFLSDATAKGLVFAS